MFGWHTLKLLRRTSADCSIRIIKGLFVWNSLHRLHCVTTNSHAQCTQYYTQYIPYTVYTRDEQTDSHGHGDICTSLAIHTV